MIKKPVEKTPRLWVRLLSSPNADKGKKQKSPRNPSTPTTDKGKKINERSSNVVVKEKKKEIINAKSPLQKDNI